MKKIYIGADHAGFELKEKLIPFIKGLGFEIVDKGAFALDLLDDYPDFIALVAKAIAADDSAFGIVIGGSGQGEAIVANRFKGVRAAVYYGGNPEIVKISREHNDSNALAIGARFASAAEAKRAVALWLATPFSNEERHVRRLNKIDELTN